MSSPFTLASCLFSATGSVPGSVPDRRRHADDAQVLWGFVIIGQKASASEELILDICRALMDPFSERRS